MKKLNLGCGKDIKKGYINLDIKKHKGVDVVHNLDKFPYPFKDNTFDEIICYNIIEHLEYPLKALKELHRISKSGVVIKIVVPHFSSGHCWGDLEHKRGFSSYAFRHQNVLEIGFDLIKQKLVFPWYRFFISGFANKFKGIYDYNLAWLFPANDIYVMLKVKK